MSREAQIPSKCLCYDLMLVLRVEDEQLSRNPVAEPEGFGLGTTPSLVSPASWDHHQTQAIVETGNHADARQ
jgi:hypothetical protein